LASVTEKQGINGAWAVCAKDRCGWIGDRGRAMATQFKTFFGFVTDSYWVSQTATKIAKELHHNWLMSRVSFPKIEMRLNLHS
jgi:hypothetical protein